VTRHVALLRAVNLGGKNKVAMADLRTLLSDLGLEDPRSLLASGNLVFGSAKRSTDQLEALLERETEARLGLATDYFVRTAREWRALVDANPFAAEAEAEPGWLLVLAAKDAPAATRVRLLQDAIRGRERVRAVGRQAYAVYPDGIGRSKLTTAVLERHLATRVTGRNWNTVLKLLALVEE
jgi:uncharacterized protein (DUF1697 family)